MAGAALPTAAIHTGPVRALPASARSASRTQRRPSTRASAAPSSLSSRSRRGSLCSITGTPGKSRVWLTGGRSLEVAGAILPGWPSAPAHDLEFASLAACELGFVGALILQALQIRGRHVAGDVDAGEARGIEFLDPGILVLAGGNQIVEVLIDQPVRADERADLLQRARARHQLAHRRHVDPVDIGEAHRRGGGGEVHLGGARLARQLDDLRGRGAAHDRVIDQQHRLAAKLEVNRVELAAHRFLALLLPGHDEGAADVAILDEAFAVLDAEALRQLQRAR